MKVPARRLAASCNTCKSIRCTCVIHASCTLIWSLRIRVHLESYVYVSKLSLPLFLEHTQSERTCEGGKGVGRRVHCRNVWNKNTKQTNKHTQTLNVSNTMSLKEKKESRRHTWPPGQASELELRRIIQSRHSLAWIILRNSSSDAWARAFSRGAGGGAAAAASWYKGFSFSKSPAITHMSIKHIKYEKYLLRWLFGSLIIHYWGCETWNPVVSMTHINNICNMYWRIQWLPQGQTSAEVLATDYDTESYEGFGFVRCAQKTSSST